MSIIIDENDELDTKPIYSMLFLIGDTISDVNNEVGFISGLFSFLYFCWIFLWFYYLGYFAVTDNDWHLFMIDVFYYKMLVGISDIYLPSREHARVELLLWVEVFKFVCARLLELPGIIRYD